MRTMKRRRTGLNTRFDYLMERVTETLYTPTTNSSGHHTRSAASSSVSSYDIPKTPADAYNVLEDGRLGRGFPLIKMNSSASMKPQRNEGDRSHSDETFIISPKQHHPKPLPDWLCRTLLTLTADHPLRLLLPPQPDPPCIDQGPLVSANVVVEPLLQPKVVSVHEDKTFAFSLPDNLDPHDEPSTFRRSPLNVQNAPTQSNNVQIDYGLDEVSQIPTVLPFSTPGPGVCPSVFLGSPATSSHSEIPREMLWAPFSFPGPLPPANLFLRRSFSSPPLPHTVLRSPTHAFLTDAPLPSIETYHQDASDSASDPLLHVAHFSPYACYTPRHPNLFSTPGPTTRRPVSFASPIDDASNFVPLHGAIYDYDALDFRWKPFLRKGVPEYKYNGRDVGHQDDCEYSAESTLDIAQNDISQRSDDDDDFFLGYKQSEGQPPNQNFPWLSVTRTTIAVSTGEFDSNRTTIPDRFDAREPAAPTSGRIKIPSLSSSHERLSGQHMNFAATLDKSGSLTYPDQQPGLMTPAHDDVPSGAILLNTKVQNQSSASDTNGQHVFAPAPGIFISPLRTRSSPTQNIIDSTNTQENAVCYSTTITYTNPLLIWLGKSELMIDGSVSAELAGPVFKGVWPGIFDDGQPDERCQGSFRTTSQSSNDSIESWPDV